MALADVVEAALSRDLFEVNPHTQVTRRAVGYGRHPVTIVDGFYRHPERIVSLIDELAFAADSRGELASPVLRAVARADLRHLAPLIRSFAGDAQLTPRDDLWLVIQGMWGNAPLTPRQRIPHNDPTAAALVYLNQPEDCSGGTALYRHRPSATEFVPLRPDAHMVDLARDLGYPALQRDRRTRHYVEMVERVVYNTDHGNADGSPLNDGNRYWELLDLIEMRFNRLVVYDGRIPHAAYIVPGSFEEVPRFVQMLSIEFDEMH